MQNVSLITDLGNVDHYAALLKGSIIKHSEDVRFIDVSHSISSHDIQEAAYTLQSILKSFPDKTIHLVSVYNYYINDPKFIIFEKDNQFFLGPNNGIFSLVFDDLDLNKIHEIEIHENMSKTPLSYLSHGVSIIANGLDIGSAGPVLTNFERRIDIMPVVTNTEMRATIIYIDQFENVVLNVKKSYFEEYRKGRPFKLFFKYQDPITKLSDSYANVSMGEVLCFFNNGDFLEIAINMGKASSMLDLYKGDTVQIFFES